MGTPGMANAPIADRAEYESNRHLFFTFGGSRLQVAGIRLEEFVVHHAHA